MQHLVEIWRGVITFDCTSVLFAHGSAVVVPSGSEDPRKMARDILRGCADGHSLGMVIDLALLPGWVVTARHPDVLTYVNPADVGVGASHVTIAYYAAAALAADGRQLHVVHVERARQQTFARGSSPSALR